MSMESTTALDEANQSYLVRALQTVRAALAQRAGGARASETDQVVPSQTNGSAAIRSAPALERLCAAFALSRFEREILLLCAGMELDAGFAQMVAAAQQDPRLAFPTFGLALAALADPHWSALAPAAPLRHWRLIEIDSRESLTTGRLRIDERVLHYLAGVSHMDERLGGLLQTITPPDDLPQSQAAQADRIAHSWSCGGVTLPVIQLCGDEVESKRAVAAAACAALGLDLYAIRAEAVPHHPAELDAFARLWQREAVLSDGALMIEFSDAESGDSAREAAIARLLEEIRGALIVSSRVRRHAPQRSMATLDIAKPTGAEQRALWRNFLGDRALSLNGSLEILGAQFNFDTCAIRAACEIARQTEARADDLTAALWESCRARARSRLNELAERIEPSAVWDDLVLPPAQKQLLEEIVVHVRQRTKVYETWGFAAKGGRGLGISALFAGPSGTGKTMAGEVLANELNLDLYRIDLSQVVNKYIGETEKNLRRVFDAAEDGGVILLFDEADALFGKRSEVKDSHDRYANIEVSYLLQKMEAYRGLAILTTNLNNSLDPAFLRRIRFVAQFPFPDAAQRAEIWRRVFPAQTPTESLDCARLARLQVAGGNIRNMAMNAAFLAAEAGEAVRMLHLLQAAKSEYGKLERSLTEAEIGDWR
jgi:ATP-dependent 26S proteasome regulatory subunit